MGCIHLSLSRIIDMPEMKSVDVEIVSSSDNTLPASGLVQLSLLDVSRADARAVTLSELSLRCGGTMPICLALSFDNSQIDPRRSYSLAVRIESNEGRLLYINTSRHTIQPDTVTGTQRVTVDKVGSETDGIHGSNLAEGIHGGNHMD
jgi:putative lipoprotein